MRKQSFVIAVVIMLTAAVSLFAASNVSFDYVFTTTATVSISVTGGSLVFGDENADVGPNTVYVSSYVTITNDGVGAIESYSLKTATISYPTPPLTIGTVTKDDNGINRYTVCAIFKNDTVASDTDFQNIDALSFTEKSWKTADGGEFQPTTNAYAATLADPDPRNNTGPGDSRRLFLRLKTPTAVSSLAMFNGRIYITAYIGFTAP
jgi:hypothetical protein